MRRGSPPLLDHDEELGELRYCSGCEEWWPNDDEFFRPERPSGRAYCNACFGEMRRHSTREASRQYRARARERQAT